MKTTRRMAGALLAALALAAGAAELRTDGPGLAQGGHTGYFGSGHDAGQQPVPAPAEA